MIDVVRGENHDNREQVRKEAHRVASGSRIHERVDSLPDNRRACRKEESEMTRHFFEIVSKAGERVADIVAIDIVQNGMAYSSDGTQSERWWIKFPQLPDVELVLPEGLTLRKVA